MKENLPYFNTALTLIVLIVSVITFYMKEQQVNHTDIAVIKENLLVMNNTVNEVKATLEKHVDKTEGIHEEMNKRLDKLEAQAFNMPKDHTSVAFLNR
jgi:hypothetical protein